MELFLQFSVRRKNLNLAFLFSAIFLLVFLFLLPLDRLSAQSGKVSKGVGAIIDESDIPDFTEGEQLDKIVVSAFFWSGREILHCNYQGDPWQAPIKIEDEGFVIRANFQFDGNQPTRVRTKKPGQESALCTGNPPFSEALFEASFEMTNLPEFSPGEYWVEFNVSGWGPISKTPISWGGPKDRIYFTVFPKPAEINLSPSLSLEPRNLSACLPNPKTEISYTVENSGPDRADNVILEIYDNGRRVYRADIGRIDGESSKSGSIIRKIEGEGEHQIEIRVDPDGKIKETNEKDNRRTRTLSLNACPLPFVSLLASPDSVEFGGSTTLTWRVENAVNCQAYGSWSGSRDKNGGEADVRNLAENENYILECIGPGKDKVSDDASVLVLSAPPPPTVSLSANPPSVSSGGSSILSWSVSNAEDCRALGDWQGAKDKDGGEEERKNITNNKSYTLSCEGTGGGASESATVFVQSTPPPSSGLISVRAELDGKSWQGEAIYDLNGPASFSGQSVNQDFPGRPTGLWSLSLRSGGPKDSSLESIRLGSSQTLSSGGTIIFTLNFVSNKLSSDNPNLTASAPRGDSESIYPGDKVSFTSLISNLGISGASASRTDFALDGLIFSQKDTPLIESSSSMKITSSFWTATGVGLHQVRACADSSGLVAESNESDNCAASIIKVLDPLCPEGDCDNGGEDGDDNNGGGEGDNNGGGGPGGGGGKGGNGGECSDGLDNDDDGLTDSNDPGCGVGAGGGNGGGNGGGGGGFCLNPAGCFVENPQCSDGLDNDSDGWVDSNDPGCGGESDNDEADKNGGTQCSDGLDNDDDGLIDGQDPECASPSDNTERTLRFEEF